MLKYKRYLLSNSVRKFILYSFLVLIIGLSAYYFYPEKKLPENLIIEKIVVIKSERELLAFSYGKLIKTYNISLGGNPVGDKEFEGDKRTPEGLYYINDKNPNSSCYKNLGISYPNYEDIKKAYKNNKPTGGDIKIHGILNGFGFIDKFHHWFDWTAGCIAVTNDEMDELYSHISVGTAIEIKP